MQGKRSGDGDQKDVEEEICVTVNNFLVLVLYAARAHSNIII